MTNTETTQNVSEALLEEHRQIDTGLTDLVNGTCCLVGEDQASARQRFSATTGMLLEHIRFEEEALFPLLEERVGLSPDQGPTAVMRQEHGQFKALIDDAGKKLEAGNGEGFRTSLRRLLQGLGDHNVKEERILYPMAMQHLDEAETASKSAMQSRAASAAAPDASSGADRSAPHIRMVDVRGMEPRFRHPLIFRALDELKPSRAIELVNDHDPIPLFYQLQATRSGQFEWTPVEQGPEVWRIRIRRN